MEPVKTLQLEKPNTRRTAVTARDADTGKSKSITVYEASPDQVIEAIKNLGKPRKSKATA